MRQLLGMASPSLQGDRGRAQWPMAHGHPLACAANASTTASQRRQPHQHSHLARSLSLSLSRSLSLSPPPPPLPPSRRLPLPPHSLGCCRLLLPSSFGL